MTKTIAIQTPFDDPQGLVRTDQCGGIPSERGMWQCLDCEKWHCPGMADAIYLCSQCGSHNMGCRRPALVLVYKDQPMGVGGMRLLEKLCLESQSWESQDLRGPQAPNIAAVPTWVRLPDSTTRRPTGLALSLMQCLSGGVWRHHRVEPHLGPSQLLSAPFIQTMN